MARPNDPTALSAHIQGLREAKAAFQAMPEILREYLNDATDLTGLEMVRHAKALILASPSIRTRALLNNVGFRLNRKTGRGRVGILAGPVARRAHFVEFGTRHMPAEPFMIPAAESQKGPYLDRCKKAGSLMEKGVAAIGLPSGGHTGLL